MIEKGRGEGWVIIQVMVLIGIFVVPWGRLGSWAILPLGDFLRDMSVLLGGISFAAGVGMGIAAYTRLGRSFTVFPAPKTDGEFRADGVYGVVRHPMYAGVILLAFGWSILILSLPSLVLTIGLGFFFDQKASFEEERLKERYAEYAAYQKRVKKMIPFIY
ncbi:MAG TPA: isoprenylcysteine carboxylmethyltransferase family protein [Aggregatilineales bacterium]|nr:isoprenylcysteine carboxylmethyltransferase family protein [Anaerolineales bacterium]HRE46477.1 isoprenylcysteine carboxylmethyltransferase family protein [Aggregatilineales bacterium]